MSDYINESLLGASPHKNQQAEAKKLVNKWDKTGLLDGLNDEFQKSGMAVMLENQAKQLISENSGTGGRAGGTLGGGAGANIINAPSVVNAPQSSMTMVGMPIVPDNPIIRAVNAAT